MRSDLPVKRIWMIKATSRIPLGALITVRRNAVLRFQDTRQVHQIPCHERDITLREFVLRAARSLVQIRWSGPGLADPASVGLWRDDVAQVL